MAGHLKPPLKLDQLSVQEIVLRISSRADERSNLGTARAFIFAVGGTIAIKKYKTQSSSSYVVTLPYSLGVSLVIHHELKLVAFVGSFACESPQPFHLPDSRQKT